jgi:hypothetical protein
MRLSTLTALVQMHMRRDFEGEEIRKQARAVLTLLAKSKGCT